MSSLSEEGFNPDRLIAPSSAIVGLEMSGAEGGSRTHTGVTPMDFESIASAIPPLRLSGCPAVKLCYSSTGFRVSYISSDLSAVHYVTAIFLPLSVSISLQDS